MPFAPTGQGWPERDATPGTGEPSEFASVYCRCVILCVSIVTYQKAAPNRIICFCMRAILWSAAVIPHLREICRFTMPGATENLPIWNSLDRKRMPLPYEDDTKDIIASVPSHHEQRDRCCQTHLVFGHTGTTSRPPVLACRNRIGKP